MTTLVDEALGEQGVRKHHFDWLLSDPSRTGHRTPLKVDAYYPNHELVMEYHGPHHYRPGPDHGLASHTQRSPTRGATADLRSAPP